MVGETDENWRACVEKTLELAPDSVTIYQMELPFNTTISKDLLKGTRLVHRPGRQLVDQAALGRRRRSRRSSAPAITSAAPTRRSRIRRGPSSSTATACGRAPTWPASASRRSATSTACTCRTSTPGKPTATAIERGETAAEPRLPADRRRAADSRARPAAQARLDPPAYFRDKYGVDILQRFRGAVRLARRRGRPETADDARSSRSRGTGCCGSTRCCRGSSCPSTPGIRYT